MPRLILHIVLREKHISSVVTLFPDASKNYSTILVGFWTKTGNIENIHFLLLVEHFITVYLLKITSTFLFVPENDLPKKLQNSRYTNLTKL